MPASGRPVDLQRISGPAGAAVPSSELRVELQQGRQAVISAPFPALGQATSGVPIAQNSGRVLLARNLISALGGRNMPPRFRTVSSEDPGIRISGVIVRLSSRPTVCSCLDYLPGIQDSPIDSPGGGQASISGGGRRRRGAASLPETTGAPSGLFHAIPIPATGGGRRWRPDLLRTSG